MFKITKSIIRGAIPILSHKSAAVCLVLNCLWPGSGTLVSGLLVLAFCRCSSQATVGCPRWHERSDSFDRSTHVPCPGQVRCINVRFYSRVCCLLVNLVICLAMMVTVPLCLVGWCWSVGWGVSLVNIASEYFLCQLNIPMDNSSSLLDKQLHYESRLRVREQQRMRDAEKMLPEPLRLDIMSLEGHESF